MLIIVNMVNMQKLIFIFDNLNVVGIGTSGIIHRNGLPSSIIINLWLVLASKHKSKKPK